MISVEKLNEKLIGDMHAIEFILDHIGMTNIHSDYSRQEFRCSWEEGSNPTSTVIDGKTLSFFCFSNQRKGNIYTLVMEKLHKNFPEALQEISNLLRLDTNEISGLKKRINLPFGGFFKDIIKQKDKYEEPLKIYDQKILEKYEGKYNTLFFKDGIDYKTQEFFRIGYDVETNRIVIPEWDMSGNLVGIMGRLNKTPEELTEHDLRWYPIIPCPRGRLLYGYHFNYKSIAEEQYCLIGESEKFVMQLYSMGLRTGLATGGSHITESQAVGIKSLHCRKVILCYDEGLSEDHIRNEAESLIFQNPLLKNQVGYIYDRSGDLLKEGSKSAPSDLGEKILFKLLREKTNWIC